ncbi:hypothetical protein L3Q82_006690 [Scortum barcoo]|uniref:Uncharacterized protein n=1 Tax=Scortum barcoo TaxID=214431 RepID=A0ACB8WWM1_9TELE|nr:hypothetical protein L3Q82_006690 [Scortum barcoo]
MTAGAPLPVSLRGCERSLLSPPLLSRRPHVTDKTLTSGSTWTGPVSIATGRRETATPGKRATADGADAVFHHSPYLLSSFDGAAGEEGYPGEAEVLVHGEHPHSQHVGLTQMVDEAADVAKESRIDTVIHFKILVITSGALNGQAPAYICELLQPYTTSRNMSAHILTL